MPHVEANPRIPPPVGGGPGLDEPLPQLDLVRDGERMRSVWQSVMPQLCIKDCKVRLVRYNPAKNKSCLVCYRLNIGRGEGSASQVITARFYPPGESLTHFLEAQQAPLAASVFGEPLFHLPALDGVGWTFPNDRKLPGIPALIDRGRLATDVVPLLAVAAGAEAATGETALELVRYNPERGCTVRLTAPLAAGGSFACYGKTYSGPKGEEVYRNMCELWRAPQRPATLGMAQPLAYDPEHHILWQSAVDGLTLAASEETPGPQFFSLLEAAGGAVAELHATPVPGLKVQTAAEVYARFEAAAGRLEHAQPLLAPRLSALKSRLLAETGCLEERPAATLHGDMHAGNVVFTGSGIALIDLDEMRAGDPLYGLASFLGSTCGRGLKHGASGADIAEMARSLLRGYERSCPWAVPRPALRWYTSAALLSEQADRRVKRMKGPSPEVLLDAAEGALNGSGLLEGVL